MPESSPPMPPRSAPAQNALSPAPRSTMQHASFSFSASSNARHSSSSICVVSELRLSGRLSVTRMIRPGSVIAGASPAADPPLGCASLRAGACSVRSYRMVSNLGMVCFQTVEDDFFDGALHDVRLLVGAARDRLHHEARADRLQRAEEDV